MMNARTKAVFACNTILAVAEPLVWLGMALYADGSVLSSSGVGSLKYFTVLSNLLLGFASLCCEVSLALAARRARRTGKEDATVDAAQAIPRPVRVLKYVSVVATTLTFMVVFAFFGPAIGYASVLSGSNLWFHLVLPVFALVEFCALEGGTALSRRDVCLALLPPLAYGLFYWLNIALNGAGTWESGNDWYGFAQWGAAASVGVFAFTLLLTWAIALGVRRANARRHVSGDA